MANVKFPLEMADGAMARNMNELKANFDAEKLIEHYMSGRLLTWLKSRFYEEAEAVAALDRSDPELGKKLCGIFGEECADSVDTLSIARRLEKLTKLRRITDSDEILDNVDSVAFDQDELAEIYSRGATKIYLCEGSFDIPKSKRLLDYTVIGGAKVTGLGGVPELKIPLPKGEAYYRTPIAAGSISYDLFYSDKDGIFQSFSSQTGFTKLRDEISRKIIDLAFYYRSVLALDENNAIHFCKDLIGIFKPKAKIKTITSLPPIKQVANGRYGSDFYALDVNGKVYYIDRDSGDVIPGKSPKDLPPIKQISYGYFLGEDGKVYSEADMDDELLALTRQLPPIKKISCYGGFFALGENGKVYCFYRNDWQSPYNSLVSDNLPYIVDINSHYRDICHALDSNGKVYCFGNEEYIKDHKYLTDGLDRLPVMARLLDEYNLLGIDMTGIPYNYYLEPVKRRRDYDISGGDEYTIQVYSEN